MMQILKALVVLASACGVLARSRQHVGQRDNGYVDVYQRFQHEPLVNYEPVRRQASTSRFLNNKTQPFQVDGNGIPDVDFDIGESYAGLLPISDVQGETRELYFWFFPSSNPLAEKEITIWLNGGPGCSSLEGMLQENGPFLWQYGTLKPVPNPWTWVNLTNVVWVEQPVGTGFSQGEPEATTEADVATEFLGFFKNFVETFSMQGYKIYIAGESYAGMFVPHIASAMLDANDTTHYNLEATMIYDPSINNDIIMNTVPGFAFLQTWKDLFALNDTYYEYLQAKDQQCGWTQYMEEYLVYPPKPGHFPAPPALTADCDVYDDFVNAVQLVNPCFDIYHIATTCPMLYDPLGAPGGGTFSPPGGTIYFNRTDVKKAINAPVDFNWVECANQNVYNTSTGSSVDAANWDYSSTSVLPGVIERSKRTIIGHGNLDAVLLKNGTLLSIQNMTWNGMQGFQQPITDDFFVPAHIDYQQTTLAASGVMGKTHEERGLIFVDINLAGHMIPQYQPSASYRHLEVLLGRIPSLNSTLPFTTSDDGLIGQASGPVDPNTQ